VFGFQAAARVLHYPFKAPQITSQLILSFFYSVEMKEGEKSRCQKFIIIMRELEIAGRRWLIILQVYLMASFITPAWLDSNSGFSIRIV
jgi:hypothetical protein